VHLHAFNLPLATVALAARRPIVFTEHGNFGLGRGAGPTDRLKRRMQSRFLARAPVAIAANSHWTAERLVERHGVDPSRVRVIPNGLDPSKWAAVARSNVGDDSSLTVAFIGRLAGSKRVDRLLEGIARARDPARFRTLIVGDGPHGRRLRELAKRLRIDQQVDFLGYREDVDSVLARTDVLVQPSEGESFGLSILEACRLGALPIVFDDGGGALEAIPPDGRVVGDETELAALFDQLDPSSPALGPAARDARARWVRERFPISRTAARYLELYLEALGPVG
jgi:glycosyltransferase involved in cell wall biosynthesis